MCNSQLSEVSYVCSLFLASVAAPLEWESLLLLVTSSVDSGRFRTEKKQ
jgi:hypothetical protein